MSCAAAALPRTIMTSSTGRARGASPRAKHGRRRPVRWRRTRWPQTGLCRTPGTTRGRTPNPRMQDPVDGRVSPVSLHKGELEYRRRTTVMTGSTCARMSRTPAVIEANGSRRSRCSGGRIPPSRRSRRRPGPPGAGRTPSHSSTRMGSPGCRWSGGTSRSGPGT